MGHENQLVVAIGVARVVLLVRVDLGEHCQPVGPGRPGGRTHGHLRHVDEAAAVLGGDRHGSGDQGVGTVRPARPQDDALVSAVGGSETLQVPAGLLDDRIGDQQPPTGRSSRQWGLPVHAHPTRPGLDRRWDSTVASMSAMVCACV